MKSELIGYLIGSLIAIALTFFITFYVFNHWEFHNAIALVSSGVLIELTNIRSKINNLKK